MAHATAEKKAYNAVAYEKNKKKKVFVDTIRSILTGRKTQQKTLDKYGWTMQQVNRIGALNPTFRLVIEDTHNVKLEKLYRSKTALPATVQVRPTPAPDPIPQYEPGLEANPKKGTNMPNTWRKIHTFGRGALKSASWVATQF